MANGLISSAIRIELAKCLWGWTPHPGQREWLLCEAPVKVAACGRRWGKTEAAAVDASTMAIARPGCVQMIVSPTYDQSRLIFDAVERFLSGAAVLRGHVKVVRTPYPRLTVLGSVITARTADEDGRNLRGNSADRVIVDEAAYVRDSVIQEVISPMLADREGKLVMISTPFGKNHFYRAFVRGVESGKWRVESGEPSTDNRQPSTVSFQFPSWDNPHISRAYVDEQREVISTRQFAVEYEAQFMDDQNSVFAWEDIEAAAARHAELVEAAGFDVVVAGIDWARYSDYTAIVALGVGESGCAVVGIDRFHGLGWSRQIERVTEFLRTHRVSAVLTDGTSIGDPLLEQLQARLFELGMDVAVDGYTFTNQSKRELVENLSLALAHGRISIPRDEQLMRELQYFEYEITPSGNVRMNGRSGVNDDLVIALALALRQSRGLATHGGYLSRNGRTAAGEW